MGGQGAGVKGGKVPSPIQEKPPPGRWGGGREGLARGEGRFQREKKQKNKEGPGPACRRLLVDVVCHRN
jgi:hypothetical protein